MYWGNFNWALKHIKNGKLKILFGRLKNSFDRLNELYGAQLRKWNLFKFNCQKHNQICLSVGHKVISLSIFHFLF